MPKNEEIQIRDPFVMPVPGEKRYYLYGTTDANAWGGPATGFNVYAGTDLQNWDGPYPAFRPAKDFWADRNFWAPEVHQWRGRYYMFASFKAEGVCRGTQILACDSPLGPFDPISDGPATPRDWECLDGTFFVDDAGSPWMIFCHEWLQVIDGEICVIRLSEDLRRTVGESVLLFKASQASWVKPFSRKLAGIDRHDCRVTDGPFMHRTAKGGLLMLWSSNGEGGYTQGLARSVSGNLAGPWEHMAPIYTGDGGHGMLFRTLAGQLMLTFHSPNKTPFERPVFLPVRETGDNLQIITDSD